VLPINSSVGWLHRGDEGNICQLIHLLVGYIVEMRAIFAS
jgi:hypothetical protein